MEGDLLVERGSGLEGGEGERSVDAEEQGVESVNGFDSSLRKQKTEKRRRGVEWMQRENKREGVGEFKEIERNHTFVERK